MASRGRYNSSIHCFLLSHSMSTIMHVCPGLGVRTIFAERTGGACRAKRWHGRSGPIYRAQGWGTNAQEGRPSPGAINRAATPPLAPLAKIVCTPPGTVARSDLATVLGNSVGEQAKSHLFLNSTIPSQRYHSGLTRKPLTNAVPSTSGFAGLSRIRRAK